MEGQHEKIILTNNKVILLKIKPIDLELDEDQIVNIDYNNIIGEILTFPVVLNRIGNLLAEVQGILREEELILKFKEADLKSYFRKNLSISERKKVRNEYTLVTKKPTIDEIENAVMCDEGYRVMKKNFINKQKQFDKVNKLYWSCKEKSEMLKNISKTIKPEDFENEILEDTINGVMIKIKKRLIPQNN